MIFWIVRLIVSSQTLGEPNNFFLHKFFSHTFPHHKIQNIHNDFLNAFISTITKLQQQHKNDDFTPNLYAFKNQFRLIYFIIVIK